MLKFLLVVAAFAALVYALMWALERRRAGKSTGGSTGGSPGGRRIRRAPEVRQVAPDDDEDFLRWLERKRRKDSPES